MARQSSSDKSYRLPLQTLYQFTVLIPENNIISLATACDINCFQAHRSLLPVDPDAPIPIYSVKLQFSASSLSDALSSVFLLGSSYGAALECVSIKSVNEKL